MILPHGGVLINRFNQDISFSNISYEVELDEMAKSDFELICNGAYSPLSGFMSHADYQCVLHNMELSDKTVWTIPITLPVSRDLALYIPIGVNVKLTYKGDLLGVMTLQEKYEPDKRIEAKKVFLTTDKNHPGVKKLFQRGEVYLSGPVYQLSKTKHSYPYSTSPQEIRKAIAEKGWKSIVGFQTRNPIHRAHEYIQKCSLEMVDGLLLHPLVGETKSDDVPASIRLKSYEILIKHYYPKERVIIGLFTAAMRYAGPREAVFHAIVRKNFGCTHFIVGRDHAGVGNYYGTYDAQKIFSTINQNKLNITPIFFEHSFYCKKCKAMGTTKTCPHDKTNHVTLSGTKVREMLCSGLKPPKEFTRPEVAEYLANTLRK